MYRFLQRGMAPDHIDRKYAGKDCYWFHSDDKGYTEVRIIPVEEFWGTWRHP